MEKKIKMVIETTSVNVERFLTDIVKCIKEFEYPIGYDSDFGHAELEWSDMEETPENE